MASNSEKTEDVRKKEAEKLKWLESFTPFRVAMLVVSIVYWYIVNEFVLSKINALIDKIGQQPDLVSLGFYVCNAELLFLSLIAYLLLLILLAMLVRRD